jgi:hypothetical protein
MPKTIAIKIKRPRPSLSFGEDFRPDNYLRDWMYETFLEPKSPLYNPEHDHLMKANIGCLWSSVPNSRHGQHIVGMCEFAGMIGGNAGKWAKARAQYQLKEWFGDVELDFLLTFDADYMAKASDATFCAVVEHELLHCGQALEFGIPKFRKNGLPKFAVRGHDVEEFVSVIWRYGAKASPQSDNILSMAKAALKKPAIGAAEINIACGTCIG